MRILFLGGVYPIENEVDILEKSKEAVHYADNKLQWGLIDGFINMDDISLSVLSAPLIGSFPKGYSELFIESCNYIYKNNVNCKLVSFCNLWGYRNISRKNSLRNSIKDFICEKSEEKVVIVYSPHTPYLQAAVLAKEVDPSIHICMIVPDLPQYMNLREKKSVIYNWMKLIDIQIFMENAKHIDSFVLLTEHMKKILNVDERPYVVIEGIVNQSDDILIKTNFMIKESIKTVVYTGTLNKKFGVVNLVKAFHEISNPNLILYICGRGDAEEIIKDYGQEDKRINYLGQLSNKDALNLQRNASVLVNPRQNNEEFTKYSFPSKNMEYLLSGKPVIAYKLDGIPNEYDQYLFYVEDNSIQSLKSKIDYVLSLSDQERIDFGKKAKAFVTNNKNNNVACKKIINMIKENIC